MGNIHSIRLTALLIGALALWASGNVFAQAGILGVRSCFLNCHL